MEEPYWKGLLLHWNQKLFEILFKAVWKTKFFGIMKLSSPVHVLRKMKIFNSIKPPRGGTPPGSSGRAFRGGGPPTSGNGLHGNNNGPLGGGSGYSKGDNGPLGAGRPMVEEVCL